MRTRIKICGLTREQDVETAVHGGADAIGLVFHPPSSRYITPERGKQLRELVPPFVTVVALLLDEDAALVDQVIETVRPDCLQFHGTETPQICEQYALPYIKSIPMGSDIDATEYASQFTRAQGFLLDSNAIGRKGGSGDTFDWTKIPASFQYPLILAGGLSPANVAEAINSVRPWAVDVSSGVETSPGIKSDELMTQFFREVNRVDDKI